MPAAELPGPPLARLARSDESPEAGLDELLGGARRPIELEGLRLLIADDEAARVDALAQELRRRGARVLVTELAPSDLHLARLRPHDASVLLIGARELEGAGHALVERCRRDARLRWARPFVIDWDGLWADGDLAPLTDAWIAELADLARAERELARGLTERRSVVLPLESLGPFRLLRAMVDGMPPLRVSIESPRFSGCVRLAEGLVASAEGRAPGVSVHGIAALSALLSIAHGRVEVEPIEHVGGANLLAPIEVALTQAEEQPALIARSELPAPEVHVQTAPSRATPYEAGAGVVPRFALETRSFEISDFDQTEIPTVKRPAFRSAPSRAEILRDVVRRSRPDDVFASTGDADRRSMRPPTVTASGDHRRSQGGPSQARAAHLPPPFAGFVTSTPSPFAGMALPAAVHTEHAPPRRAGRLAALVAALLGVSLLGGAVAAHGYYDYVAPGEARASTGLDVSRLDLAAWFARSPHAAPASKAPVATPPGAATQTDGGARRGEPTVSGERCEPREGIRSTRGERLRAITVAQRAVTDGDYLAARRAYCRAFELDRQGKLALGALISTLLLAGDGAEAQRWAEVAHREHPTDRAFMAQLAEARSVNGDTSAARELLLRSLDLDDRDLDAIGRKAKALHLLADRSIALGSNARAARLYRRTLLLAPESATATLGLARALDAIGASARARYWRRQGLALLEAGKARR